MSEITTNNESSKPQPEVSEEDRALAGSWEKKIKAAKRRRTDSGYVWNAKELAKYRNYVNGTQHDDGPSGLVRTNLIYSTIATMLPMIYAKNPDISVTPSESVEQNQYKAIRAFCKTLELVLRRIVVRDGFLKKRTKSMVRSTMTTSIGWVKVIYQRDYGKDPIIQNRIADIQDNLKRVQYLTDQVGEQQGNASDHEAKRAELMQQVKALEEQVEIVVAEGIVIDRILTEDMFVLDDSIRDFDAYPQARAIAHRVWYQKDQYAETFGSDPPSSATVYKQPRDEDDSKSSDHTQSWYAVFEICFFISQTIYTKCDGADRWCRDPYQPKKLGERWYPFFALAFNPIDGQFEPLSDVQLLKELQDEYNTTRTNFADHRKENLPGLVVRKGGGLSEDDISKIANRKINEIVVVEGDPGRKLSDDLMEITGVPIDPAVYDVSAIRNDMDVVSGLTDASRSNLLQSKTLGEAEIMRDSMMSRTSERQDTIEDCLQEVMQYSAEICLQEMSVEQVKRIAGQEAQWPQLSKNDVFDMVRIEIRAGTTGKPNKEKDREQWVEFMPVFQDMVAKTIEMRAAGNTDLADAMIEMIKETLRRFDERLDIDLFVPNDGEGQEGAAAQELMQLKQKLEQMMQENEALKQAADANQAKTQQVSETNQTNRDIKIETTRSDNLTRIQIEKDRNASNERIEVARMIAPLLMPKPETEEPGEIETAQPQALLPEHIQQAVAAMMPMIEQVMNKTIGSDVVPVRDETGRILRLRREPPQEVA